MDIMVNADYTLSWNTRSVKCALGKGGIGADKIEGDGKTPIGCFALERVLYRPDRIGPPETALPVQTLRPADGWCDDPEDYLYNRPVQIPYPGRHEVLWRDDAIYDIIVVLAYNTDPVVAHKGSAIFLHVARDGYAPTEGCIALAVTDLQQLLQACRPGDRLCVNPQT